MPPPFTDKQLVEISNLMNLMQPLVSGVELTVVLVALSGMLAVGLAEIGPDHAQIAFDDIANLIESRMQAILEAKEQASVRPPGATLQ